MVQEGSDAQVLQHLAKFIGTQVPLKLVQEILPEDIKALLLIGLKCRADEAQQHFLAGLVVEGKRTEVGLKLRLLLPVKEHGQPDGFVDVAHVGLAGLWNEVVLVAREVAQERDLQRSIFLGLPGHVSLQVGVARVVVALGVQ